MGFIHWSEIKHTILKRRWSFGSGNESNQDTPPPEAARETRTIAEPAIPAALCLVLYGSIPPDVQHHPSASLLYDPLVACIFLVSLSAIIYALANPDGDAAVEATKRKAMAFSVGVLLVAFVLRILLLLSVASMELVGLVFLCFAAVAVAALCFLPLKVGESSGPVAGEPARITLSRWITKFDCKC